MHSVATQVLLPEGLAIHVVLKHNSTLNGDAFLGDVLIGRLDKDAEKVTPGPHSWDGSYTQADFEWKGHKWRVESAHDGGDLVLLVSPVRSDNKSALPPRVAFAVNFLWNSPGTTLKHGNNIEARTGSVAIPVYCTCPEPDNKSNVRIDVPISGSYFAFDLNEPAGVSTGKRRSLDEIRSAIEKQKAAYEQSIRNAGKIGPIFDAIETTIGWDTIYDPEKDRVISPVSRVWSVGWGGYVLFDWDTFFAATLAGIGDKDWPMRTRWKFCARKPRKVLSLITHALETGKAQTARSRRWARLRCWGFMRSFMIAGFSKMRLIRC